MVSGTIPCVNRALLAAKGELNISRARDFQSLCASYGAKLFYGPRILRQEAII